jgi:hypothetical protein
LNQTDHRPSRNFKFGTARIRGNLEPFHLFNGSAVRFLELRPGPNWLWKGAGSASVKRPMQIRGARDVQVNGQIVLLMVFSLLPTRSGDRAMDSSRGER